MIENILKYIEKEKDTYVSLLADIAQIESPTECKAGVDAVGAYVADWATARGFRIEIHKEPISGNALCITMNEDADGAPVCFSAHMDTVHPIGSIKEMPVRIEDGKIYGPGVCDCKGGIASSLLAMDALYTCGFKARPVRLILQSDEETSSRGSEKRTVAFMCEKAKGACAFLNCEPHRRGLVTTVRKGISRYELTVMGKAEHSAECYLGKNAIAEAAQKIIALEKMKDPDGITANCGLISGGTAENTVAEKCTFTLDVRYASAAQMAQADATVKEIASTSFLGGTTCSLVLKSARPPMEACDKSSLLLEQLNDVYKRHGLSILTPRGAGGGSDAAYVTASGIPCLDTFGVVGGGIHAKDEHTDISSLSLSAKMLALAAYYV